MAIQKQDLSSGGFYSLELDGAAAGRLAAAAGGLAIGDIVEEKLGTDHVVRKHIGGVKYSDIELSCDATTITGSAALQAWIQAFLSNSYSRKNGAVVETGTDGKERSRLTFNNALISGLSLPALDASNPGRGALSLKLTPESARLERPSAAQAAGPVPGSSVKQGSVDWTLNNFRVKIDGLDCTHVSLVDPIGVTQAVITNPLGELRDYELQPSHLEYSDLVLILADNAAQSFYDWHTDFVVNGNNGADKEKAGTVEIIDRTLKNTLFTLSFTGLGIFKLAPVEDDGGTPGIRRVVASLYCETIAFSLGPPATATDATIPLTPELATPVLTQAGPVLTGQYPTQFTRFRRVT